MASILGTAVLAAAAVIIYLNWFSSWVVFDVERRVQAPMQTQEPAHIVQPIVIDHRGIAEIINASHQNLPLLIVCGAAVAVCAIFAWMAVRITDNRRYLQQPYQERLPAPPREESRALTVIDPANTFSKWKR